MTTIDTEALRARLDAMSYHPWKDETYALLDALAERDERLAEGERVVQGLAADAVRLTIGRDAARAKVARLTAVVERVRSAHPYRIADNGLVDWCDACQDGAWPCKTVLTLDGAE